MDHTIAMKAVWAQRGAPKWAYGWQGRQLWRSGAHRGRILGEPKMLKNRETRGTAAGAQERAQEGCRFRLAWAYRNGLPGEHKTRITRDSGSGRRAHAGLTQPPAPPVVTQKTYFLHY